MIQAGDAAAGRLIGMMPGGSMAIVLTPIALTDRMPAGTIYSARSALSTLSASDSR
jgi:hypothetical protein